jgi:hypothetical protein
MLDEIAHLRNNPPLLQLLTHYARLAEPNRDAWQNRLMSMDSVEPAGMTQLHGELLAFGWIELNGGQSDHFSPGVAPACYRMTVDGLRAYRRVTGAELGVQEIPAAAEKAMRKVRKRRREKKSAEELTAADAWTKRFVLP